MADNLHWTIGDVTITRVVESVATLPASGLLPSASDEREHEIYPGLLKS